MNFYVSHNQTFSRWLILVFFVFTLSSLPEDKKLSIADFNQMVMTSVKSFGGGSKRILIIVDFLKSTESGVMFEVNVSQGKVTRGGSGLQNIPSLKTVASLFDTGDELVVQKKGFIGLAKIFSSSRSKLFIFLDDGLDWPLKLNQFPPPINGSLHAFDVDKSSLVPLQSSVIGKTSSYVISAYGKVYYFVSPASWPWISGLPFTSYDPNNNTWDSLPNFPLCFHFSTSTSYTSPEPYFSPYRSELEIIGYAVCNGFIILSMSGGWELDNNMSFAYGVHCKRWFAVQYCNSAHYPFRGRAVVIGNTIFALSKAHGEVIAFSVGEDYNDAAGVVLSLSTPTLVPWVNRWFQPLVGGPVEHGEQVEQTEAIVHLGDMNFCLLQTALPAQHHDRQSLYITSFEILNEGGSWVINAIDSTIRNVNPEGCGRFLLKFCFAP